MHCSCLESLRSSFWFILHLSHIGVWRPYNEMVLHICDYTPNTFTTVHSVDLYRLRNSTWVKVKKIASLCISFFMASSKHGQTCCHQTAARISSTFSCNGMRKPPSLGMMKERRFDRDICPKIRWRPWSPRGWAAAFLSTISTSSTEMPASATAFRMCGKSVARRSPVSWNEKERGTTVQAVPNLAMTCNVFLGTMSKENGG